MSITLSNQQTGSINGIYHQHDSDEWLSQT